MRKVFLDDLPRWDENSRYRGRINWRKCVGYKIKFIYDDIEDEIEIVSIDENSTYEDLKLNLRYKDKIKLMDVRNIRNCRFGVLVGKHLEYGEFKYEINEIVNVKNSKLKLISKFNYKRTKYYTYECLVCGNKDKIREYCLCNGTSCNVCANKKVLVGFNDLWSTHPEIARLLKNKDDGYKITHGTQIKQLFQCPICGYEDNKLISNVIKIGVACPICSDGLSYPTKFMIKTLEQLNINFTVEKTFKWSKQKRYDFYIPSLNCIIEMHGEQHYTNSFKHLDSRTLEEEQENDIFKENLAKENGIKNYIIIDCYYSDMKYIKNNIMKSKLNNFLDLTSVNWLLCDEFAVDSLVKKACDLWNKGYDSTTKVSEKMKLERGTVIKYLKRGTSLGWCDYDPKEAARKSSSITGKKRAINIVQLSSDGQYIKTWNSAMDVKKELNILDGKIGEVCKGKRKSAGGFIWMYKDDYENKNKSVKPVKIGTEKKVVQLDLEGEVLNEFPSISDACKEVSVSVTTISRACKFGKISCGFRWMYKEDYDRYIEENDKELIHI